MSATKGDYSQVVRWITGAVAVVGITALFLFQRMEWMAAILPDIAPIHIFIFKRVIRFLLNDLFAVLLVLALLGNKKYVIVAIWVQVFGMVFILIPYIALKISFPSYNGPLISFLHRLILNPILIYLLLFYFWQDNRRKKNEINNQ